MATGQSTSAVIGAPVSEYYDKVLLTRLTPFIVHDKFGQKRPLPKKSGTTVKFRRYNSLTPITAPLEEGINPSAQRMSKSDYTATPSAYGAYVEITDYVDITSQDPVLTEAAELLGENAAESLDMVFRDILNGGTSVFYAGSVDSASIDTRVEVASTILEKDIQAIVRALKVNKAKPFTEIIAGQSRDNTYPIAASYYAICSPQVEHDLRKLSNFIPVEKYADPSKKMEGECGSLAQVRFVVTTNAKIFEDAGAAGVDVHSVLIFGKDAYGVVEISGESIRNIIKSKEQVGGPLEMYSTSGWKAYSTAVILDESRMYRYECAVSA